MVTSELLTALQLCTTCRLLTTFKYNDGDRKLVASSQSLLIGRLCCFRYKLIFEPQKTVAAKVGMVVEKSTGGRWRFELKLEATQPEVDGSVTILAAPGQSALGSVLLYSPTDQPQAFTCHFTHDSSISFDVSPSEVCPRPPCVEL